MASSHTLSRRAFLAGAFGLSMASCTKKPEQEETPAEPSEETSEPSEEEASEQADVSLSIDMTAWNYDRDDNVWWQKGIVYCSKPAAEEYESLAIYVPGAYLKGKPNDDGITYTCRLSDGGSCGSFTTHTAPVLLPINGGSYAGEMPPASYNYTGLEAYLETGCIYVYAGFRGRNNAYSADGKLAYEGCAPWPAVDLKAAIRWLRYNAASLPGDFDHVFAFGLGAGGTLANLLAASGDAPAFESYLEHIGAPLQDEAGEQLSDAIYGAASWCAEADLPSADAAYEWLYGQYAIAGSASESRAESTWTCELSRDLAAAFAPQIEAAQLADEQGNPLVIEPSAGGIFCAGSYYDYLRKALERSLLDYLDDVHFPLAQGKVDYLEDGNFAGGDFSSRSTRAAANGQGSFGGSTSAAIVTYQTPQEYVAALDAGEGWLAWDEEAQAPKLLSLSGYARTVARPERAASGYDTPENLLFGNGEKDSAHFSQLVAEVLQNQGSRYAKYSGWDEEIPKSWSEDMKLTDSLDTRVSERLEMFDPLSYLAPARANYGQSKVAAHWRLRFGTHQGVTPFSMYENTLIALRDYDGVASVSSELVWGQGHVLAERSGDAIANLIAWIESCQ